MTATGVTALTDDLAIGRAVYGDAHRRGDALATARAAARLRAHIADLDAAELAAVRTARQRFGKAIREARSRRLAPPVRSVHAVAVPLRASRRVPLKLAAVLALLALLLAAVAAEPLLSDQPEGGAGAAAAVDATDPVMPPITLSRGRVILAVAAVEPIATPVEAAPVAEPVAEPAPEASPPTASGAGAPPVGGVPGGSGAPASGTGTGSGGGNGTAAPSPAPAAIRTPAPTFAVCFSSVPRGFARLCGRVVDTQTGRPIAGACVSQGPCKSTSALTDPNGQFTFQLVVGSGQLVWNLEFSKAGYGTTTFSQTSRQGRIILPTQYLSPH